MKTQNIYVLIEEKVIYLFLFLRHRYNLGLYFIGATTTRVKMSEIEEVNES